MNIGEELKRLRTQQGLSLQQVADQAGITNQSVSAYEHGKRDPSVKTLEKLASGLGYAVEINFVKK